MKLANRRLTNGSLVVALKSLCTHPHQMKSTSALITAKRLVAFRYLQSVLIYFKFISFQFNLLAFEKSSVEIFNLKLAIFGAITPALYTLLDSLFVAVRSPHWGGSLVLLKIKNLLRLTSLIIQENRRSFFCFSAYRVHLDDSDWMIFNLGIINIYIIWILNLCLLRRPALISLLIDDRFLTRFIRGLFKLWLLAS